MKFLTTTAVAVLLVGGLSALALAPAANADDAPAASPPAAAPAAPGTDMAARGDTGPGMMGQRGMMGRPGMPGMRGMMGMGGPGGLLDIACGDRGAEALELALVHVKYAVGPTATQAPLLDALKTAALADQKTFAATCETARSSDTGKANILDRLQSRLTIDNARVTAMTDVMPKFKAFYDSLTDDQKAKLEPRQFGGPRMGMNGMGRGPWGQHGWHHGAGKLQPGAGNGPATPADVATPDDQDASGPDGQS